LSIHSEDYWRRSLPPEYARRAAGRWVIGDDIDYSHRILQILGGPGKSGMGIVYICYCECNDDLEEETVAIKTLQNRFHEDRALIERFKWEAETWVKLGKHHNIVEAKRVKIHGEKPYIYLEYVSGDRQYGSSLSGWIHNGGLYRNGKPDIPLILDFAIQFCHGMMHAEKRFQEMGKPFVHRDIKPSNIMVTRDRVVKITDFGLVKAFADLDEDIPTTTVEDGMNRRLSLSKSGSVCGTPPYMSPEQCRGSKDIDVRSDIYAFGCVLYEMLTRRLVFDGRTMDEFIRHHLKTKPRSPNVQPDLDAVVMKCLEKRPANRYADFKELEGGLSSIYRKLTGKEVRKPDAVPLASRELNNKGLSLLNLGLKEEAVSCFLEALRINPDDNEIHINLGDAYKAQGKLDEAITEYWEALRIAPGDLMALRKLGDVCKTQGRLGEIAREYEEVLKLNPNRQLAHIYLGDAYKDQGKLDEAVREYLEALRIEPDDPFNDAHEKLADVYKTQGEFDKAIREYREALRINPDRSHLHVDIGKVYQAQGKLDEAIREYREELRIHPDSFLTHYTIGRVYQAQGKLDEAAREYQEELRINPDYAYLHSDLGEIYQAQGKLDEAIREYREELRRTPNSTAVHNALLNAYHSQGKLHEVIREYREELRRKPNDSEAHIKLGDAYKAQGKLDEAIREYREALRIKPDEIKIYGMIGKVFEDQGKLDEAINEYREVLKIDPHAWAHSALGEVYQAQGKLDEAAKEYQEELRIHPQYTLAHLALGDIYQAQGKLDEAVREYREELRISPNDRTAHYKLALNLEATGEHNEALEHWKRYLAVAWGVPEQKERIPEAQKHIKDLEKKLR